jgi:hypothetical protein
MAPGRKTGGRVAGKSGRSTVYDEMKWAWKHQGDAPGEIEIQKPDAGKLACLASLNRDPDAFRKELLALDVKFTGKGEQPAAEQSGQDGKPTPLPPDPGEERYMAIAQDLLDQANQVGKYVPKGATDGNHA